MLRASELARQTRVGKRPEGLGELCVLDLLVAHHEALEQRLVPLPLQLRRRLRVGRLAVREQVDRLVERRLDVGERLLGEHELRLGLADLSAEPILLGAQELKRDGAVVVGMEEFRALVFQLCEPATLARGFLLGLLAHAGQRLVELLAHRLDVSLGRPHGAVGALDRGLDRRDRDVALRAAGSAHAPVAEEVAVGAAVALRVRQPHARPALPAEERALQVVVVLAVALLGVRVSVKHRARPREALARDERLVASVVVDAGVAHGADVVGVTQQCGELCARDRFRRLGRRGSCPQAAFLERRMKCVERVSARAVGRERPAHVWRALGVDLDGPHLAPLDHLPDVQVTDRRPGRRAA